MHLIQKKILSLFLLVSFTVASLFFLYTRRPFRTRMAAFVTDLSGRTPAQRANIIHAGELLSGVILTSQQVFSLNESAGPFTLERGYESERSFQKKQVVFSPGGGVCQLSSTLYNTARLAGLEIVERVGHSRPVESVPPGLDAALAYGISDLKLKNPYLFPIKITTRMVQDQLELEIWGREKPHGNKPTGL